MLAKGHRPFTLVNDLVPVFALLNSTYDVPSTEALKTKTREAANASLNRWCADAVDIRGMALAFDHWTSDAQQPILGVTARFVTPFFTLCPIVLAFRLSPPPHTAAEIALQLKTIMKERGLSKVRAGAPRPTVSFTHDSAANCKKATLLLKKDSDQSIDEPDVLFFYCAAHRLQLAIKLALSGKEVPIAPRDPENPDEDDEEVSDLLDLDADVVEIELTDDQSSVDLLDLDRPEHVYSPPLEAIIDAARKLVAWARVSPKRLYYLRLVQEYKLVGKQAPVLGFVLDVQTRWNSSLLMLRRLIQPQISDMLQSFQDLVKHVAVAARPDADGLDPQLETMRRDFKKVYDEWEAVAKDATNLVQVLELAERSTSVLSRASTSIGEVIPEIHILVSGLRRLKSAGLTNNCGALSERLVEALAHYFPEAATSLRIFNEPHTGRRSSPASSNAIHYLCASLLCPLYIKVLPKLLVSGLFENVKDTVRLLLVGELERSTDVGHSNGTTPPRENDFRPLPAGKRDLSDARLNRWRDLFGDDEPPINQEASLSTRATSILEDYLHIGASREMSDSDAFDPLCWWSRNSSLTHPTIRSLVQHFLCMYASSASAERLFSAAGLVTGRLRNRLSLSLAEASLVLSSGK